MKMTRRTLLATMAIALGMTTAMAFPPIPVTITNVAIRTIYGDGMGEPAALAQQTATNFLLSMPFVTVLTPTSYCITNGTLLKFPDTTTMWLNIATNRIWSLYTNSTYGYPYGGTIYVEDGDNPLSANIHFASGILFSNFLWSFRLVGCGPALNTFIFPNNVSYPTEGLITFGLVETNTTGGQAMNNGSFFAENLGFYASINARNDVLEVCGANFADVKNCFGGATYQLGWGNEGVFGNRNMVATGGAGGAQLLTVMRFISHYDGGLIVENNRFNQALYGVVEDVDHAHNYNNVGGGMPWGALIHSRVNQHEEDVDDHTFGCSNIVLADTSLFPAPDFVGNFGPGNYQDAGTTWSLNCNTLNNGGDGAGETWNVFQNMAYLAVPITVRNAAGATINYPITSIPQTTAIAFNGNTGGAGSIAASGGQYFYSPNGGPDNNGLSFASTVLPAGTYKNLVMAMTYPSLGAGTNVTLQVLVNNGTLAMSATVHGPLTANSGTWIFGSNTTNSFTITNSTPVVINLVNNTASVISPAYVSWSLSRVNQ